MSEHAIEFLQEWIGEKCCAPTGQVKIEKQAETLAKRCTAEAAEAGIALEDIQEEVGDIQELIASRLEDAAEAEKANGRPADSRLEAANDASGAMPAKASAK